MNTGKNNAAGPDAKIARGRNWDVVVRLTHWLIAAAILVNVFVTEEGSGPHVWIGYAAFAALAIRLAWGVFGPSSARFASFPPNPAAAWSHLKELIAGNPEEHHSHNPLGALMVYALWGSLAIVIATGIAMEGPPPFGSAATDIASGVEQERATAMNDAPGTNENDHGEYEEDRGEYTGSPESFEGNDSAEWIEELHEIAAWLLVILAGIHVVGVIVDSRISGVNRARAMMFGGRHR